MFDVSFRTVSLRESTPRETPAVQANTQKILEVVEWNVAEGGNELRSVTISDTRGDLADISIPVKNPAGYVDNRPIRVGQLCTKCARGLKSLDPLAGQTEKAAERKCLTPRQLWYSQWMAYPTFFP
jgi:hypothetical protein